MNNSDILRAIGYSVPIYGSFTRNWDYATEMKRWNSDYQKNVGKSIRYPMRSGTDLASLYGNAGRSLSALIDNGASDLMAMRSQRHVKYGASTQRSLLNYM